MMRFRVFAWLATLLVLAGCVESNVEESISREINGVSIERSCERIDYRNYLGLPPFQFGLYSDSANGHGVVLSLSEPVIVVQYIELEVARPCYFYLKLDIVEGKGTDLIVAPLVNFNGIDREVETAAFLDAVNRCQILDPPADERYFMDTAVFLPGQGYVSTGNFIGCHGQIRNHSMGFEVESGAGKYRIVIILDEIFIERLM